MRVVARRLDTTRHTLAASEGWGFRGGAVYFRLKASVEAG